MRDGTDTFTRMIPISTPDIFASTVPTSEDSSHSTSAAYVHHAETHRTSSGHPDDPLSPSPTLVFDGMLLTESHSSVLAPASASLSRLRLSSVPDLSPVTTEGEGRAKSVFHKENDAPNPSPIVGDIMTNSDLPPQLPLPKLMTDVTIIAGHSRRSLNYTGDHPQNLSHGQYNIV
ncbi:hypothetical protein EDB83DRAFT_2392767 [Lactarius deliciosus]|nr:hypothetical protein EDB83DRAFT_2392767 [Lactarius deliciosus]